MKVPQQQRARDTREALLAAGRQAFATKGHDGTNLTTDILEPAGVSAGSFYHQFSDKTELLLAVIGAAEGRRRQVVFPFGVHGDGGPPPTLAEAIGQTMERFLQSLDDTGHDWRIQVRERANPNPRVFAKIQEGRDSWAALVHELLSPYAAPDGDTGQATFLFITFCVGLIATYLDMAEADRVARRADVLATSSRFLTHGVGQILAPSGAKRALGS